MGCRAEGKVWSRNNVQSGAWGLAENYLPKINLEHGDVVRLDNMDDMINISDKTNDMLTLGIISSSPGFLLNSDSVKENYIQ